MTGATGNIYVGLHEFVEMSFALHLLRAEDLFLDLGANVGVYTVLASGVAGARTVACEPVPATFERLDRNVRVNGIENLVTLRRTAVGTSEGVLTFTADQDARNRVAPSDYHGAVVNVPVTTVDLLLQGVAPAGGLMVWKADLEGYEAEMLHGATGTMQTRPPDAILIEGNSASVRSTLQFNRFVPVEYQPFTRVLADADPTVARPNHFWVRGDSRRLVAERLASAASFEVQGNCI